MIGQKFGEWTVLELIGKNKYYEKFYKCVCDCGNTSNVRASLLKIGKSKRCRSCKYRLHGQKLIKLISFGEKIGNWTVLGRSNINKYQQVHYDCLCECGKVSSISSSSLRRKRSFSCRGCINKKIFTTHGKNDHYLYRTWTSIKQRCYNLNNEKYKYYGGRGINICDRWLNNFDNFINDIGERPIGTSLDRIDNDGNYEPTNCKWVDKKEQTRNRRLFISFSKSQLQIVFKSFYLRIIKILLIRYYKIHG